ncbi:7890_t:CDS:2, partial [Racocetra persica]
MRGDYLSTDKKIDEIIESCISENTRKATQKWEVLNGKMKVLKQSEKVTKHHDPLSPNELKTIFNHKTLLINTAKRLQYRVFIWCCLLFAPRGSEHSQMKVTQFTFLSNGGIQFTKFSQKNDPGGIEKNLDSLIIPVSADPEG